MPQSGIPSDPIADRELMQGVSVGDKAAIGRLYARFGALVYRMAFMALPSREEAEDAVQEVFIRLWRTAGRYDSNRAALVTWVMLISRRYLVDRLRRTRTALRAAPLDESHADLTDARRRGETGATSVQHERFTLLMAKIDKLPPMQRQVVVRAYLNGQTLRQIGEELGTPLGTIKSALSRALVRLRETELSEGAPA